MLQYTAYEMKIVHAYYRHKILFIFFIFLLQSWLIGWLHRHSTLGYERSNASRYVMSSALLNQDYNKIFDLETVQSTIIWNKWVIFNTIIFLKKDQ